MHRVPDISGSVTREPAARAVSTDISGTLTPEPGRDRCFPRPRGRSIGRFGTRERVVGQRARCLGVTTCSGVHWNRWLGAVRHLWVHPPRRKRYQPCSSCGAGARPGAERHPTRPSGEDPSLQVPMERAQSTRGDGFLHFPCSEGMSIGRNGARERVVVLSRGLDAARAGLGRSPGSPSTQPGRPPNLAAWCRPRRGATP